MLPTLDSKFTARVVKTFNNEEMIPVNVTCLTKDHYDVASYAKFTNNEAYHAKAYVSSEVVNDIVTSYCANTGTEITATKGKNKGYRVIEEGDADYDNYTSVKGNIDFWTQFKYDRYLPIIVGFELSAICPHLPVYKVVTNSHGTKEKCRAYSNETWELFKKGYTEGTLKESVIDFMNARRREDSWK